MSAFFIVFIVMACGIGVALYRRRNSKPSDPFPPSWRTILETNVAFYSHLTPEDKKRFEDDVIRFLEKVRIEGVSGVKVDITDKLLVASSAVIPVFGFPEWDYAFLDEVLLYPGSFDSNFGIGNREEYITGMVGTGGVMEGKMILSKPSLHQGFSNTTDKQNVGIHEFIHLLDKEDGTIDGVPTILNNKLYSLPWLELIRKKTEKIVSGKDEGDDINPYGATNQQEFLAVTGEYFFERPHLLKKNHPELYDVLAKAFNQDTASRLKPEIPVKVKPGRNSPCLCGSGKKYKDCCLG